MKKGTYYVNTRVGRVGWQPDVSAFYVKQLLLDLHEI